MSKQLVLFTIILITWILLFRANADPCPRMAEEASNYTFKVGSTASSDRFFYFVPPITWNEVIRCDADTNSCSTPSNEYSGTVQHDDASDRYNYTLTINNVNRIRDETTWRFGEASDRGTIFCDLKVYSKIPTPVCTDFLFTDHGKMISWTCNVSNVYPETECLVAIKINDGNYSTLRFSDPARLVRTTGTMKGNPGYYDQNGCIMSFPTSLFNPNHNYTFKMVMFPGKRPFLGSTIDSEALRFYGPTDIFITVNDNDDTLMYDPDAKFVVYCDVLASDVFPKPFVFLESEGYAYRGDGGGDSIVDGYHRYTFELNITRVGNITVKCVGFNFVSRKGASKEGWVNVIDKLFIMNFETDVGNDTVEVSSGEKVMFTCEAEGNPLPEISILGPNSNEKLTSESSNWNSTRIDLVNKTMVCRDSGVYTCRARSSLGITEERNITVLVKCPPVFIDKAEDVKDYTVEKDSKYFTVLLPLASYPPPTEFTLFEVLPESGCKYEPMKATTTAAAIAPPFAPNLKEIDPNMYSVRYQAVDEAKGNVVVTGEVSSNSGQFTMMVENGIGEGTKISFNVVIPPDDQPEFVNPAPSNNGFEFTIHVGFMTAICIFFAVVFFLLGMKFQILRNHKKKRKADQTVPMTTGQKPETMTSHPRFESYDHLDLPPTLTNNNQHLPRDARLGYEYLKRGNDYPDSRSASSLDLPPPPLPLPRHDPRTATPAKNNVRDRDHEPIYNLPDGYFDSVDAGDCVTPTEDYESDYIPPYSGYVNH